VKQTFSCRAKRPAPLRGRAWISTGFAAHSRGRTRRDRRWRSSGRTSSRGMSRRTARSTRPCALASRSTGSTSSPGTPYPSPPSPTRRSRSGPRVFYRPDGSAVSEKWVRGVLKRVEKRAGLAAALGKCHKLRHTFCSRLATANVPMLAIQKLATRASRRRSATCTSRRSPRPTASAPSTSAAVEAP
jgi:integrase